ncbi:MAG TPA: hypothetical protein VF870_13830 [Ignavibacteriaceae bacterium]
MKTLSILFFIVLFSPEIYLFSQQQNNPFVTSHFIGEKLDRIEENYFHLFPAVTNFQEATFFLNQDSSLTLNLKYKQRDQLIDTTMLYMYSLYQLRNRINQVVLEDIRENKVKEIKLSNTDTTYAGTVYSFDGKQIRLIKKGYTNSPNNYNDQNYLPQFNYSDIRTVTIGESSTAVKIVGSLLGMLVGGLVGFALTPEPRQPETFPEAIFLPMEEASKSMANTFIGLGIGGLLGFFIGGAIDVPVDYDVMSPGTKTIIYDNSLLSKRK